MGNSKSGYLREAWEDTEKRHVICFIAFILIIAVIAGGYFGVKAIIRGENTIQGSWEYAPDIENYGDSGYTMHFTSDNRFFLNSELAANSGTYTITDGGLEGKFNTNIAGVIVEYEYTLSDNGNTLYLTTEGSSVKAHTRVEK